MKVKNFRYIETKNCYNCKFNKISHCIRHEMFILENSQDTICDEFENRIF